MAKQETSKSKSIEIEEVVILSKNPDTEGFDIQAGETWIYPTNYPLREYQYTIIQQALLNNTMVSLPTGLGKTFIAAVVMYNFYRWYPTGKVIFMAPTRPLVKQQIDACYNIMAIPKEVTAELTGTKVQTYRKDIWKEKRVFFITPQVLQNDLSILTELGTKIKCIVFDEAHKAKGNYAYCEVIRKLLPQNKNFRVLALSATPGSSLNDVLEVIRNLLISHLEIRTDESPDVTPYVFERSLETVVVPLGEKLQQVRDSYIQILEKYTRVLVQHRVITGNCSTLTKGKIFMTMKDYQQKSKTNRDRAYSDIMRNLNICVTLYHAYELLVRHGLRGFLSFFEEHADKPLLRGNIELQCIMQEIREYLGPAPNVEPLPDGTIQEIPESSRFGHPKFYKLSDILVNHFQKADGSGTGSRVIVFCEYRESVMEAYALLLRQKPLIRPRIFLGQGAITQRQQINVIKAFKQGECNTLISTCIGEEGLDVGEVDLIVCFDINNKSPVRMVQRMGRTGRKREGRVVILVTEGKEQQTLKECLIHKQNLTNHILQSSALYKEMYAQNPRMIPVDVTPKCYKMHITVTADSNPQTSRKKSNNLKDMFDNISNKKSNSLFSQNCDIEVLNVYDRLPVKQEYWNKDDPLSITYDTTKIDFAKKLGKLRVLQPTGKIEHSKNSKLLVSLLQFAESKKYNIPLTQVPVMPSQINQSTKIGKISSSDGLKQADIRNMFLKPPSSTDLIPHDSKEVKISQEEEEEEDERNVNKQMLNILFTEISTYLTFTVSDQTNCKICENLFDCSQFTINTKEFNVKTWVEPDFSIFNSITTENLSAFADSLNSTSDQLCNNLNVTKEIKSENKADIKTINTINAHNIQENKSYINERSIVDFEDSFKQSPFKLPKNVQNVLKKCDTSLNLDDSVFNNIAFTQMEDNIDTKCAVKTTSAKATEQNKIYNDNVLYSLNVNAFDEAEFTQIKLKTASNSNFPNKNDQTMQNTLMFFNITALEELFENGKVTTPSKSSIKRIPHPCSTPKSERSLSESQDTIIYTPNEYINSNQKSPVKKGSASPILCSFERVRQLKNKCHKRLFANSMLDYGLTTQKSTKRHLEQTSTTVVKLTDTNNLEPMLGTSNKVEKGNNTSMDIFNNSENTLIDRMESTKQLKPNLSKLLQQSETTKSLLYKSNKDGSHQVPSVKINCHNNTDDENDSELDIIDTSFENCPESIATSQIVKKEKKIEKNPLKINSSLIPDQQHETNHKESAFNISDIIDLSVFGLDTTNHESAKQTSLSEKKLENINSSKIKSSHVNRNDIVDTKSRINKNSNINTNTKQSNNKETTVDVKNVSRDCVTVLQDFCDETFIDMFLESDPSRESASIPNKTQCGKQSTDNIANEINDKSIQFKNAKYSAVTNSKDNRAHKEKNSVSNIESTIALNKNVQGTEESRINLTHNHQNEVKGPSIHKSEHDKKFEEKNEWKEESIWDFCMNWTRSDDNESKSNIEVSTKKEKEKNEVIKNNSIISLVRKKQKDNENHKNYNEKDLTSHVDNITKTSQNDFTTNKNEQSSRKEENNPDIIDLTEDSPGNNNTSPTLLKSQRNDICTPLKSQQNKKLIIQKLNYPIASSQNQVNAKLQKRSNNLKSIKSSFKTNSKLQLNSKDNKNSITSMEWFKKTSADNPCNDNSSGTITNSKLHITVTPTKTITSQASAASIQKNPISKCQLNSIERECDMNDCFNFTFNHNKPLMKSPRKLLSLSKVLDNCNETLIENTKKFDITPKKNSLKDNEKLKNTPNKRKNLNKILESIDDTDDDFELPKKTTGWINTRRKNLLECSKSPITKNMNRNVMSTKKDEESVSDRKNNAKKKLEVCPYIDHEAEVSMTECPSSDSDCEVIEDKFEESFVDDETQNIANNTEMHAHYMQSVRSPLLNRGKFKIPKKPAPLMNVYSQQVDESENTYVNDTFCVNTENLELSQETKQHDLSALELAELVLEQKRILRKRRKKCDDKYNKKRRRILEYNSDSD